MKIVLCTILLIETAMAASVVPRVLGGRQATPHEFPHMISLQWVEDFNQHFCGGTLLNERWVLTAGHCAVSFMDGDDVVAGAHSLKSPDKYEQRRKSHKKFLHEKYNGETGPYDIALIYVSEPFEFNNYVHSVHLPSIELSYPTGHAIISGWGSMSNTTIHQYPDLLMKAELPIQESNICFTNFSDGPVHKNNICAGELDGSKGVCDGDSGSALVKKNSEGEFEILGVTSRTWKPCGTPGKTGLFVNVSHFLKWIKEKMEYNKN